MDGCVVLKADIERGLSHHFTHDGYPRLTLHKDGTKKLYTVHRLVATAFLGLVPESKQVNHKNGIKSHNFVENLEYVTISGNAIHAYEIGLRPKGDDHPRAKLTWVKVRAIRAALAIGVCGTVLAKEYDVTPAAIHLIKIGSNWKEQKLHGPKDTN